MHGSIKAITVALAVPLLTAAIALSARSQWDERWQAGLRRQFLMRRQPIDERVVARYSLAALCSDPRTAAGVRPCRAYNSFSTLRSASLAVGGLGLLLLGGIAVAGAACRSRRTRLASVFPVGVHVVIGALVVLVLLHAALAVAGLYLLGEVIERWPGFIVFGIGVAALLAALGTIQVALALARHATTSVVGRAVDEQAQPRLFALVSEVAASVGTEPPRRIVAGLDPGFFVTEARVVCLDGPLSGRVLYLSLPLARILSVEELRAVLAHELAHFRGPDALFSQRFYPVYAGVLRSVAVLKGQSNGVRGIVALPVLAVLSFFLESFAVAEALTERERELAADHVAAAVSGARVLAAALVKIHAFAPAWDAVCVAMDRAVAEGEQYENASHLFAEVASANAGPERLRGLGIQSLAHPTDRHPSLARRLDALSIDGPEVAAAALDTRPPAPAITLLDDVGALERSLSEIEHSLLALDRAHADLSDSPSPASST